MATIFDALLPSFFQQDSVAIYDQNFSQLFIKARAIKAVVKEDSMLMEHPIETGAVITDHRILEPIEIEISFSLQSSDYLDVYRALKQTYINATLLVVQTKSGTYPNQLIKAMPHEEDPGQYNQINIAVRFRQVQFVTPQFGVLPKNPGNSTAVDRGVQESKVETSVPKKSAAAEAFDAITG